MQMTENGGWKKSAGIIKGLFILFEEIAEG
jgi:hypothetical protein